MTAHFTRTVPRRPRMSMAFAKWDAAREREMVGPDIVKEWLIRYAEKLEQRVLDLEYAVRVREAQLERAGDVGHDR